ncbi:MAG: radical SAM protein [Planctomycetes bacterium]|nr:radical SAM protein [Planctomycetota bacterium]
MRRQYGDLIRSRLRAGGLARVVDAGVKVLGPLVPLRNGHAETGPILGTVILSYACNYRCGFCELPQRSIRRRREGWTEFDTAGWKEVLDGFAALRTVGVGFTGGEPFLRKDCAELLEHSLSLGMVTHVNTNSHLLDDALVERLVAMGLDSVNVSLDGADAATHDRLRGHPGSFDRVTDRIAALARARDRHATSPASKRTRVAITSVLTPDNASQVEALADLAERLGADSLGFIPMHEYAAGTALGGVAPARPWAETMVRASETLLRLKHERAIIENSESYIGMFPSCFAGRPLPIRCRAPETSLAIDCYGRVFPCVPLSEVDTPIGRVTGTGLASFWKSETYAASRRSLASCRACYWNCHTEMNLLWPGAGKAP